MSLHKPAVRKLQNRATLSAEVADHLCRHIRRERLAPGAHLGTEIELAEQYGVSRTVIREAIGHLRGLGMVISRPRLGLSVASNDVIDTLGKVLAPMVAGGQHFRELCRLRFIFEAGALPLAVEHATPEQIGRMRRLAEDMLDLIRRWPNFCEERETAIMEKEIAFHQSIFEAADSEFVGRFHELLLQFYQETGPEGPHIEPASLKGMQEHLELVEAIADRDVGRAIRTLTEHLRQFLTAEQT